MKKSTLLVCLLIGLGLNGLYFETFVVGFKIDFSTWSTDGVHWFMRFLWLDLLAILFLGPFAFAAILRRLIKTVWDKDPIGQIPIFSR